MTVHGLFEVTAGSHTFYFLLNQIYGDWIVFNVQLTVLFIPTAYGTVEPIAAADGDPDQSEPRSGRITSTDLAAERAESGAANLARMEREMADMRSRLERLEAELAAEREGR